jgi:cytidylate kinase
MGRKRFDIYDLDIYDLDVYDLVMNIWIEDDDGE